jgi:carbonic anhydrase
VQALQAGNNLPGSIASFVRTMKPRVEPALRETGGDLARRALGSNVRYNVEALRRGSPILTPTIERGELQVRGIYDLATGRVAML